MNIEPLPITPTERITFLTTHAHLTLKEVGARLAGLDGQPRSKQWVQFLYRRYRISRPPPAPKPPGTRLGITAERLRFLIAHQPPGTRAALIIKALVAACSCSSVTIHAALKAHQIVLPKTRKAALAVQQLKYCYHCKQIQPFSSFYKNRATSDGLQNICKSCILDFRKPRSPPL